MSVFGHVIGGQVDPDYDGGVLTADLTAGDTTIQVDDVADFDETAAARGGRILLGVDLDSDGVPDPTTGTALAYSTCDDDASTITLVDPSPVAASAGDRIYIENPVTSMPVGQLELMVALDDADTTGSALPAIVDLSLLATIGDADLTDQAVEIEEDEDDQLVVTGFPGLAHAQANEVKAMQDQTAATGPGDQTLQLTYRPMRNSEHVYWNGVYQPGSEWIRDGWTITLADPDGLFRSGDTLVCEYLYKDETPRPIEPASLFYVGTTAVDLGATHSQLTFPEGSLDGDVWVLTMYAGNGFGDSDARVDEGLETRMIGQYLYNYDFGSAWPDHHCVAWGRVSDWDPDTSSTWLHIALHSSDLNTHAYLSTYRVTGSVSMDHPHGPMSVDDSVRVYFDDEIGTDGLYIVALATGADSRQIMESAGWTVDYAPDTSGHGRWHALNPTHVHVANQVNTPHEDFESWLAIILRITEGA